MNYINMMKNTAQDGRLRFKYNNKIITTLLGNEVIYVKEITL